MFVLEATIQKGFKGGYNPTFCNFCWVALDIAQKIWYSVENWKKISGGLIYMVLSGCVHKIVVDDVLSLILNIVMTVIALASAVYACRAYRHQRDRSKKAAACELAKYYAEVILEKNVLIAGVLRVAKLDAYIKGVIASEDIVDFDECELKRLLEKKNVDEQDFLAKIYNIDPFIILNYRIAMLGSTSERQMTYDNYVSEDPETGERHIHNESFLRRDFFQEITNMLNQLEWFSMSCRYGLADEELLYQSLHQTFIEAVWELYPFISRNNVNNEDKFFTNVMWLFDRWSKRRETIKQKADKTKQALLQKADAVKPEVFSGRGIK